MLLPEQPENRRLSDIPMGLVYMGGNVYRVLLPLMGRGRSDIFRYLMDTDCSRGGLGAHAGAENIGASVIPMSSGNTEKQITLMHDFGSTVLCCTPSLCALSGRCNQRFRFAA